LVRVTNGLDPIDQKWLGLDPRSMWKSTPLILVKPALHGRSYSAARPVNMPRLERVIVFFLLLGDISVHFSAIAYSV